MRWNYGLVGDPEDETTCIQYGGIWDDDWCDKYDTTSSTGNSHYHLGNYYNWTAAVAMSDSSSYTADNTDVDQSICPAGWMLPKSGTTLTGSGSFIYLKNEANLSSGASGNIHTTPNWFVYGGNWDGSLNGVGVRGYYWSSVVYRGNSSYRFSFFQNPFLTIPAFDSRGYGSSVRCVAR